VCVALYSRILKGRATDMELFISSGGGGGKGWEHSREGNKEENLFVIWRSW